MFTLIPGVRGHYKWQFPRFPHPLSRAVSRRGNSKGKVCAFARGLICTREPLQVMEQQKRFFRSLEFSQQPPRPPLDSQVSGSLQGQVRYKAGPVPGVKTSQKPTPPSVRNQDLSAPVTQVTYFQVTHSSGLSTRPLWQTRPRLGPWGAQDLGREEWQKCK